MNYTICGNCDARLPKDQSIIEAHMDTHLLVGGFRVNVWNVQARVEFVLSRNKVIDLSEFPLSEEDSEKLSILAEEAVEVAGGWMNVSGLYPVHSALAEFALEMVKKYQTAEMMK